MKKKLMAGIGVVTVIALTLSGCGKVSTDIDYNAKDYVTLGQYEGVEVNINKADYEVTEDKINDEMVSLIQTTSDFIKDDSQTVVKEDSIVNVDYEGKKDGVAFTGGTAKDVWIDVAKNSDAETRTSYITGFTTGLVGTQVGSTVDVNVTFPENYGKADLAGQPVTFTFTINGIAKNISVKDITDEYLQQNTEYTSVEQLREAAKSSLETTLAQQKTTDTRSKAMDAVQAVCTVNSLPEEVIDLRVEEYLDSYKKAYVKSGSLEDNVKETYSLSLEEFKQQVRQSIESNMQNQIVYEAIAADQNMTVDGAGFTAYCEKLCVSNGYTSVDNLYQAMGVDNKKDSGKKYLERIYLCNKALDFCVEKANVVEQ